MLNINKILFITLSNIGDVILTLPLMDNLRTRFPEAKFTVMVGPRPSGIFANSPFVDRLIIYNKHAGIKDKIRLFNELKKEGFDIVVDLRNSLFGVFLPSRYKTSPFKIIPNSIPHMKDRHLQKAISCQSSAVSPKSTQESGSLCIGKEETEYIENVLKKNDIGQGDEIAVIAAGARSHIKRWRKEKFAELIRLLIKEFNLKIVLVGDKEDVSINADIVKLSQRQIMDLTATTNILQLAALLKKARILITNDSAVLHLGSYLNTPTVAIFGPTDELKYGPWSKAKALIRKEISCRPCRRAQCAFGTLDCMELISVEDVLSQVRKLLMQEPFGNAVFESADYKENFRRILIVRTDRIGDVILSTPVIRALRDYYPSAYIAMMVAPVSVDIVRDNPYLDEILVYDKDGRHKNWMGTWHFVLNLKRKKFDLAVILHPTNRVHILTFLAGVTRRVGFDRKLGFLLTDRVKHTKQEGLKHELEYSLDIVRYLGIEPQDKSLFMPIHSESESWVERVFNEEGIAASDRLLAIHPAASCPSKIWPQKKFSEAADILAEKYGLKLLVVSGPKDVNIAQGVINNLHHKAVNLAGRTSVSQLASVFRRVKLVISNDSGPVHIASGVGTPVISIFGRNQKGLSPVRWGPLGRRDKILHKEVACMECLAHNCEKGFLCLEAISVADVVKAADLILED